ncbi:MAG: hypothetical protein JSV16_17230 [Candidatus Hydrogenedentota bacterium]|nr:MAG: hypothetical protein JSV16_17230 [Candidatus Hydrogenedentota bacterium]
MRCVMGIDAGGTHTRCQIASEDGRMLSIGHGGPANTNFVSLKSAQSALGRALSGCLTSFNREIELVVIAGPHLPPATATTVSHHAGTGKVIVTDEFEASLAAALHKPRAWGVVIMSGTGSFCKGRNVRGEEKYVGGWGPLIGDEGSGYDIAKEALGALVRACDGRGKETVLTDLMLSHLKICSVQELKTRLYRPPLKRHKLAELATCVFTAAGGGDEVAVEILRSAGLRLANLASPVVCELFGTEEDFPVVLSGGIPYEGSIIARMLASEIKGIRPRADVFVSDLQPVSGTVIIGLHSIGVQMNPDIISNLKEGDSRIKHLIESEEDGGE